jgi:toxin ParE1/3/4
VIQSLSFSPEAREELFEAVEYYNSESPGLGASFLASAARALEQIQTFPESAPVVRGTSRIKPLLQFPYSLIYSLRLGEIRVLAVMSQRRRPFYWWGRD